MPKSTSAVLRSTTGTAPITITTGPEPGIICIALEDGSEQHYRSASLLAALQAVGVLPETAATDA